MIKFTRQSVRPDGEVLYRLEKDGEVLREGLTLDEVVEAINRMDEERAGLHGGPVGADPQISPKNGGPMRASAPTEKRPPHTADRETEVRRGRGG